MNATALSYAPSHAPHSLAQCAQNGYWYCSGCERVLDRRPGLGATGAYRCHRCGSGKVHYQEPIHEYSPEACHAELF
jgi:hypothetical protein